jgi:hypothetical protein
LSSKNELTIKKLRETLNKVYDSKENVNARKKMNRYLKMFEGELWNKENIPETDTKAQVNYLFSTVMTIAPTLTDNKPVWGVRSRDYFMQRYMQLYDYALEYFWDKEEIDIKIFDATLSSLIAKIGIYKVYFDADNGDFGDVCIEVVDPRTFIIAPGYTDPWKAPWCFEKLKKPLSWVKEKFPDECMNLKPDKDDEFQEDFARKEDIELSNRFVTIYTGWIKDDTAIESIIEEEKTVRNDKGIEAKTVEKVKKQMPKYPHGRLITFGEGYDKPLEDRPSPFLHGKPPYVIQYNYKVPFKFMGMGEGDQIEDLHKEFNLILQKICNHVRRYADPNFAGDANNGIDAETWKKEAPGGGNYFAKQPGTEGPTEIEVKPINRTATDVLNYIASAIEEVTGVTDITKGVSEKKQRQSAREIATLVETAYTRTRQRVRNLEWAIKRLCYLVVSLMQQNYGPEIRNINVKREENIDYKEISNTREFVGATLKPPDEEPQDDEEADEFAMREEDYKKFIEVFGEEDQVYADFDITIETNSTLPLDKQSMANLFLQLASVQLTPQSAIDVESLLEALRIPNKGKIIERLKKAAQSMQQPAPAGPQLPPAA